MKTDAVPLASSRPPAWLIASTGALAVTILVLAVAETGLMAQYLIDEGEYVSVFGLVFIAVAGGYLAARRRLASSLPLVFPWLLYPVITQGDQIIDNLSINAMRIICQVLLAAIFATPVAIVVLTIRGALSPDRERPGVPRAWTAIVPGARLIAEGRRRMGSAILVATLLAFEIWLAQQYLGALMVITLAMMIVGVLLYGSQPEPVTDAAGARQRSERFARFVLVVGVAGTVRNFVSGLL